MAEEQRVLPERLVAVADEAAAEHRRRRKRAESEHGERDQHGERRFVRDERMAVAMIVVVMRVASCARPAASRDHSPRLPKKVMNTRRQE